MQEEQTSAILLPKVAVVIPTHNRCAYVCDAVESVLSQSYSNVEAVVVDDASTDGTPRSLREKYGERIRLVEQKEHGEKCRARNAGIRVADAEYVCMLDSDDILLENSVAARMAVFLDNPSFDGVVYGAALHEEGRSRPLDACYPEGDILLAYVHDMSLLNNNAFLLSKENMMTYGLYNPELTNMEDRELLVRLAARLPFRFCGTYVQKVRRLDGPSAGSSYTEVMNQGRKMVEIIKGNEFVRGRLGEAMVLMEYLQDKETATACYKAGKYKIFRQLCVGMWKQYPGRMLRNGRFLKRYVLSFVRHGARR